MAGAVVFLGGSVRLVRDPGPVKAIADFRALLIQLTVLLVGALAERWLPG